MASGIGRLSAESNASLTEESVVRDGGEALIAPFAVLASPNGLSVSVTLIETEASPLGELAMAVLGVIAHDLTGARGAEARSADDTVAVPEALTVAALGLGRACALWALGNWARHFRTPMNKIRGS